MAAVAAAAPGNVVVDGPIQPQFFVPGADHPYYHSLIHLYQDSARCRSHRTTFVARNPFSVKYGKERR